MASQHDSVIAPSFSDKIPVFDVPTYGQSDDQKGILVLDQPRNSGLTPIEFLESQLPQVVSYHPDNAFESDTLAMRCRPRSIPDDPMPVEELDDDDDDERGSEDHCDDEWEDSEDDYMDDYSFALTGRRSPRNQRPDLQNSAKALQLLGIQQPTPHPASSIGSPRSPSFSNSLRLNTNMKAIKVLGLDSPSTRRSSMISSLLNEDISRGFVSELSGDAGGEDSLPGDVLQANANYHNTLRALQNTIDGGSQPWTPAQADVAIAVGVVGGVVGLSTVATGTYNAAQNKRSADASDRSAFAAELSAETAVTKLMLDASKPPLTTPRLQHPSTRNTHHLSPIHDSESRFSPDSDIHIELPAPRRQSKIKSPPRQTKAGVEQSMQNVKMLQRQLLAQASQKHELERRRQNIEAFKHNLKYRQGGNHNAMKLPTNDNDLDKRLRQERKRHSEALATRTHVTSSNIQRHSNDETRYSNKHGASSPLRSKQPHVANMMAQARRQASTSPRASSEWEASDFSEDGTRMHTLVGRGSQSTFDSRDSRH